LRTNTKTQKAQAIETHSRQADAFAAAYATAPEETYRSCFTYSRRRLDAWLDRLMPAASPGSRLLDVGCGTGHHLARYRRQGFEVVGVDGSAEMLALARAANPGIALQRVDLQNLPFADATFDVVLSIEVLRYLPEPALALREMARVLRPGGVVVATAAPLFNLNGYWLVNRLACALPQRSLTRLKQFFVTSAGLRDSLREAGFDEVEVHGVYLGPINWVQRLAPRALPAVLRGWERFDIALTDRRLLRELANMFVAKGVRESHRS
jgi:SAM-dependent methyltransferase